MKTRRGQALGCRVEVAGYYIGGEDVGGVGVWVAQEVRKGDGRERVVVTVRAGVDFHHFRSERRVIGVEAVWGVLDEVVA